MPESPIQSYVQATLPHHTIARYSQHLYVESWASELFKPASRNVNKTFINKRIIFIDSFQRKMAPKRGRNSRKKTDSDCTEENCWIMERGVKTLIPETSIPTIAVHVPELKKTTSYWQIGTLSLSRVKINSLRPDAIIHSDRATTITGMFSEGYEPIETLGTTIIHICDIPVEVHVTRSEKAAPIVADGILGYDFMSDHVETLAFSKDMTRIELTNNRDIIEAPKVQYLIPDYLIRLRRKLVENSVSRERGMWSIVSKELQRLRDFLPQQVAEDESLPVIETLQEYVDRFYLDGDELGPTPLLKYSIKMKDPGVVFKQQPELSDEHWNEIERQIKILLKQKIIKVSKSPYNSPVMLIEKKPNSKGKVHFRFAVDFRELNNRSQGDAFPTPDIIDLVDQLHGAKYFSVLDLASASYQIALDPKDSSKTAFTTRSGRYEFLRMPPGIKNASQYLQRLMHEVLDGMICPSVAFVCHDDILIHASTLPEQEIRLRKVLSRLRDAGLKLQPDKCQMFQNNVKYLGYRITDEGLRPDPVKINKLKNHPLPSTAHNLSSYLGLLSSFKRFIPNYASRAKEMSNLLKSNGNLQWNKEARASFDDLKKALSEDWLLRYPDWNREFILETSSSRYGISAALMQKKSDKSKPLPIAYASRCYSTSEAKEDLYNQERLAAIYGMETFYWYFSDLEGKKFTLKTAQPKAFDWFIQRKRHNEDLLGRFEIAYSGKNFNIQRLATVK